MAEEDDQKPEELSLSEQLLAEEEQDVLFKTQMAVANFFLGYWKHMLAVLGVSLLAVLGYSLWDDHQREKQKDIHKGITLVEDQLSESLRMRHELGLAMPPGEDFPDGGRALSAAATDIQAIADSSDGVGATFARLRAASLWDASGDANMSNTLLEQAGSDEVDGILAWSVQAQLAASRVDKKDVDGAAAMYREAATSSNALIAEEASFLLGRMLKEQGRSDEATQALNEFIQSYPQSVHVSEAASMVSDLSATGG